MKHWKILVEFALIMGLASLGDVCSNDCRTAVIPVAVG
jgi:hypothetical protein